MALIYHLRPSPSRACIFNAERLLLPPKFQQPEPQRVCATCRELLLPIQPLLAGSIAPAVRLPVHDVTDWSAPRALLK